MMDANANTTKTPKIDPLSMAMILSARMGALEQVLMDKGILTREELNKGLESAMNKIEEAIHVATDPRQGTKLNKNGHSQRV